MKELIISPIYNDKGIVIGQEYHGELIRCKDCKYCETATIFGKTTLYTCIKRNPAIDVLADDYCSKGRRKDGTNQ